MSLPIMTPEQRADALAKARIARNVRADALDAVRSGRTSAAYVLGDKDSPLQRVKVRQLLCAIPGIGAVTAGKLLEKAKVDPKRRVAGLGDRQRAALKELLAA